MDVLEIRAARACVLLLIAACASNARREAPEPDRAAIEALLAGADSALQARDVDGVLAAYDPGDKALVERTRIQAQGAVSLQNLRLTHRIARLSGAGDEAEAVVLRDLRFDDHGRDHIS